MPGPDYNARPCCRILIKTSRCSLRTSKRSARSLGMPPYKSRRKVRKPKAAGRDNLAKDQLDGIDAQGNPTVFLSEYLEGSAFLVPVGAAGIGFRVITAVGQPNLNSDLIWSCPTFADPESRYAGFGLYFPGMGGRPYTLVGSFDQLYQNLWYAFCVPNMFSCGGFGLQRVAVHPTLALCRVCAPWHRGGRR